MSLVIICFELLVLLLLLWGSFYFLRWVFLASHFFKYFLFFFFSLLSFFIFFFFMKIPPCLSIQLTHLWVPRMSQQKFVGFFIYLFFCLAPFILTFWRLCYVIKTNQTISSIIKFDSRLVNSVALNIYWENFTVLVVLSSSHMN